jgi:ABC-2 type transport system permease protein
MPIYDQGYRRRQGRGPLRSVRFWPITREALRLILARRAFLALLAAAWIPFVVRVIQVYIVTQFPEAGRVLPVDGRMFGEFLNQQIGFAVLLTIFGGAGLVANDLRTGAILVYLSRALTRRDYVLGKLSVLLVLNLAITLVPGLLLHAISLALAPGQFRSWELAWIAPFIVVHAALISLVLGLVGLAVSALSRSARVAGVGIFGLIMGLELVRLILRNAFDRPEATLLSLQADLRIVGATLFGASLPRFEAAPWWAALATLLGVSLACLALLRTRVRAVEIVR